MRRNEAAIKRFAGIIFILKNNFADAFNWKHWQER